uniref:NADH dehydrogenase subunit 6 n=1 Tax=Lepas australis TaxID=479279 RepID=A0A089NCI1_9CRUS|nr:NADH dehydrogenase subunit 6 [Lepas australis]AIQ85057.1 NADH dehydrogenase subunit 6 [Lepas australis]
MLVTLLVLMFILNFSFVFMFHPLAMIMVLIAQSVVVSITLFSISHFPWFSYTLILVFLGGMLILFTYMANIASNEKFTPNFKVLILISSLSIFTLPIELPSLKLPQETKNLTQEQFTGLLVLKPFDSIILPLIMLMAGIILLTLLGVVKISKMNSGPLRID